MQVGMLKMVKYAFFAEKEDLLSGFHDSTYKNYFQVTEYLLVFRDLYFPRLRTDLKRTYLLLTKNELYLFT